MREKSYVSKTIRKWFNRHRSQKEEENLDLSDITSIINEMNRMMNRENNSYVLAW